MRLAHPLTRVELWTMDEHRLGLKPVIRKVWAKGGHRPVVKVHHRYEWVYGYCFVRPTTGEPCWLLMPEVSSVAFSLALAHFAREVRVGEEKRVLQVSDGAGYHTGKGVEIPKGVEFELQPAYSPELQPAEHLWPLTDEGIANQLFTDLRETEEALAKRCIALAEQPQLIRSATLFHWWPQTA